MVGLAVMAGAYASTVRVAPAITVEWRPDVPADRQAVLEARYFLKAEGGAPQDRVRDYALLDTSRRNLAAMLADRSFARLDDIDAARVRLRRFKRSHESTWVAAELPGLRRPVVQQAYAVLCVVAALVGLGGLPPVRRRLAEWFASADRGGDRGDPFDRRALARRPAAVAPRWVERCVKLMVAALVVAAIGLPVVDSRAALVVGVAWLTVALGEARISWVRLAGAVLVCAMAIGVRALLPGADIAEGHQVLLLSGQGDDVLARQLPPPVFDSWRAQFEKLYPADEDGAVANSWRGQRAFPDALHARSSDALWRPAEYSRQVDGFRFHGLADFRGGFTNELRYNFFSGHLDRRSMPFYVMYKWSPASVGSSVGWTGQAFWEGPSGFERIVHDRYDRRVIAGADVGRRVYAAFFPERGPFTFEFVPSMSLRLRGWLRFVVEAGAVAAIAFLLVRPRWGVLARALLIAGAGYAAAMSTAAGRLLGGVYPPIRGGDDGLLYESFGRDMALWLREGHWRDVLRGVEDVYWFTPGMRYFRMIEKWIFGDTNHLYLLVVIVLPLVLFHVMQRLGGTRLGWLVTAVAILSPAGNLAFLSYVDNASVGYSEALGMTLFLSGLVLVLPILPGAAADEPRTAWTAWCGGSLLAAALIVRPTYVFAIVWIGAVAAGWALRRGQVRLAMPLGIGLALALLMPLHNWYFGHERIWMTKFGETLPLPLGPADYLRAAGDTVRLHLDSPRVTSIAAQFRGWVLATPFMVPGSPESLAMVASTVRLSAAALACWIVLRRLVTRKGDADLAVLAVAAICAQLPMVPMSQLPGVFVYAVIDRYAMLGWDLSVIVAVVWIARAVGRRPAVA